MENSTVPDNRCKSVHPSTHSHIRLYTHTSLSLSLCPSLSQTHTSALPNTHKTNLKTADHFRCDAHCSRPKWLHLCGKVCQDRRDGQISAQLCHLCGDPMQERKQRGLVSKSDTRDRQSSMIILLQQLPAVMSKLFAGRGQNQYASHS